MVRRKNLRTRARKKLPYLLKLHDYKCFYCQCHIHIEKLLKSDPNVNVILVSKKEIHYTLKESLNIALHATVDHILEISKGGRNDIENLVPACKKCNLMRSAIPKMDGKIRKKICVYCKKQKEFYNRALCVSCAKQLSTGMEEFNGNVNCNS